MAENSPGKIKYFYYVLPSLVFITFFSILLCDKSFRKICLWDSDINWIIKTGEYIYTNGFHIPVTDIFSYTYQGMHWVVYQWLFEVISYFVFSIGGYTSLGTFSTVMLALLILGLYLLQKAYNVNHLYAIIAIIPGVFLIKILWYARPAMFSYVFIVILMLLILKAEKKSPKYLYGLPILFLIWANMHLGFTFGVLLLLIYLVYKVVEYIVLKKDVSIDFLKILTVCTFLSVLATLLTPYGVELYTYMFNLINSPGMNSKIQELLPPDFHTDNYNSYIVILAMIIILSHWAKRPPLFLLLCVALTCYMSLTFVRNVSFFAIFSVPILGIMLQSCHESLKNNDQIKDIIKKPLFFIDYIASKEVSFSTDEYKTRKIYVNIIVIVVFILMLLPFQNNLTFRKTFKFSMDYTKLRPLGAYDFALKYKIPGNMYAPPTWGSYAIAKLYPEYKTFIDTRFDMYGDKFFSQSVKILNAQPGWDKLINKYNVNWLVLPRRSILGLKLDKDPNEPWKRIYKDKAAFIFLKNTKENKQWFVNTDFTNYKPFYNKSLKVKYEHIQESRNENP